MDDKSLEELVRLCQNDLEYVAELWTRLKPISDHIVSGFAKTQEEREEFYQESKEVLIQALKRYNPQKDAGIQTYFKKRLYWYAQDLQKRQQKIPVLLKEEEMYTLDNKIDDIPSIEDKVLLKEQVDRLYWALNQLKPKEKELITALYLENKSISDVALMHQASYNQIESRKRRVLKKIRNIFDGN